MNSSRTVCVRCRRPESHCWCGALTPLETRTRVLFVQHPRERSVPIGTARMAHLALSGSTWVEGVHVDDHPAIAAALDAGAAVLYPGADARPAQQWDPPPPTVIVVDGTWWQAHKVLRSNPRLAAAPRIGLTPASPGNYRIRKEPSDQHLATVEAVAELLGILEGDPQRFRSLLKPFEQMVQQQLAAAHGARRKRVRSRPPAPVRLPADGVVLYAEANCHTRHEREPGAPEALHIVAVALDGRRFESVLRPRRTLAAGAPARLGIARARFDDGEDAASALARLTAFLGDAPWLCWGPFARDLLLREGLRRRGFIDVRQLVARRLGRSPGGIENAARDFGVTSPSTTRAGRMAELIAAIAQKL